MNVFRVDKKQNLIDVCLQVYGTTQQLFKLAKDNGLRIDSDIAIGDELLYDPAFGDFLVLNKINTRGLSMVNPGVEYIVPVLTLVNKDNDYQGGSYNHAWGDGAFVYVAAGSLGLLSYSVDVSGILTFIDSDFQGGDYVGVWGDGAFVYAACASGGLKTYSVDGSGILTFIDSDFQIGELYNRIWGDGAFVYAASLTGSILSYSVDGAGLLTFINSDNKGGNLWCVYGNGSYIFVGDYAFGYIRIYSVDGSGILTYEGFKSGISNTRDFQIIDNILYTTNRLAGLSTYSISGTTLTLIDSDDQTGAYIGLWTDGTKLYATSSYFATDLPQLGLMYYSLNAGILTFDSSDKPTLGDSPYGSVWSDGTFVYFCTMSNGLFVYKLESI